ncbi:uracil-DNA glycosylase [Janthinobacterium sp. 17J80-10]|uniref:uracil-DNA glycosylase n=1 Tax=Janthinobacterium sp. 17J80-10 TaxID=2497863 RepID=UPI0010053C09|nr:uracil-DNA glycosylase [Janthinobacterium sp. 17J80-10]QAU34397.1 uracil-DNA glycosylase [Janthinobacterium sp. 17J80-10]
MTSPEIRRTAFLQEMGVGPVWRLREAVGQQAGPAADELIPAEPAAEPVRLAPVHLPQAVDEDLGDGAVPAWVIEEAPFEHEVAVGGNTAPAADIARMDWDALQAAVAGCTKCRLCENRTRTVFGTGDRQARWLFVGEGPGHNEDLQGEPFVGPAGKLLDNMMGAMGLRRGVNTYIANIVKCRPIGENGRDRSPLPDESATCLPYLERQIALIRPSVIVALGKSAALALLNAGPDTAVASLRGRVHRHAGVPVVVTYHPAYLLRKPEDKGQAWRDLCLAMATHAAID